MKQRLIELLRGFRTPICEGLEFKLSEENCEKIAEYLIGEGVIVPPCKVGDKVYCIQKFFNESTLQGETIVKTKTIDFVASSSFLAESDGLIFVERDFGKTVFRTREEAERALKG